MAWFAAVLVSVLAWPVSAAEPASTRPPVQRAPEYAGAARVPESVFERPGRQALVLPSEPPEYGEDRSQHSGGTIARLPPDIHRLPEGYVVANRPARIEPHGPWYEVQLAHAEGLPDAPALRVLPNGRLALLETILAEAGGAREFAITGRVTEFQGNNYLLLENVTEHRGPAETQAAHAALPLPSAPSRSRLGAQSETGVGSQTGPAGREPTAEEVVRQLMQSRPRRAVVLPQRMAETQAVDAKPQAANTAPQAARDVPPFSEESVIVDRPARIVPSDRWWVLAFEDPSSGAKPRPLYVLPNQLLETAVSLTAGGTNRVVLLVSGELTAYKGCNYLLLRKVLVRRDMGNFR